MNSEAFTYGEKISSRDGFQNEKEGTDEKVNRKLRKMSIFILTYDKKNITIILQFLQLRTGNVWRSYSESSNLTRYMECLNQWHSQLGGRENAVY